MISATQFEPPADAGTVELEDGRTVRLYRFANGIEGKWSGRDPLPRIGAEIDTGMNEWGKMIVHSYFAEGGWTGVLAFALRPPKWWKDQERQKAKRDGQKHFKPELHPLVHIFGIEIKTTEGAQ